MTREPVLPALRAAVFAAVCLGLGVAAHRLMSGTAIPAWAMVLGGIGAYVPARLGTRRERGLVGILLSMGVTQIALHLLFASAQHVAVTASTMPASMPGMHMPSGTSMAGMTGMAGTTMPGMGMPGSGGAMSMGAGMLLAHALAAVICAWWLRRGEAAVHRLARGAAGWVLGRILLSFYVATVRPVVAPAFSCFEPVALALRSQWLRTVRPVRGPPPAPSFT